MATKTFTIDTGEWAYPDKFGVTHMVTNGQTFTIELTDGGASAVTYQTDIGKSVTTTDGLRVEVVPTAGYNNIRRTWGPTADAQDGVAVYGLAGELVTRCPMTGDYQYWKPVTVNVDNVDAPTSITATFEDQFGNEFSWSGVTIS